MTQLTAVPADLIGAQALPMERPADRAERKRRPAPAAPEGADRRLVVREVLQDGLFVYTVVDQATGRVLVQLPQDQAAAMAARPDYTAGQVIDTTI